jgi:hypothetical protein
MDDIAPKKVGKEAMLDKKKEINAKLNKNKDDDGMIEFSESDLMGGDVKADFY